MQLAQHTHSHSRNKKRNSPRPTNNIICTDLGGRGRGGGSAPAQERRNRPERGDKWTSSAGLNPRLGTFKRASKCATSSSSRSLPWLAARAPRIGRGASRAPVRVKSDMRHARGRTTDELGARSCCERRGLAHLLCDESDAASHARAHAARACQTRAPACLPTSAKYKKFTSKSRSPLLFKFRLFTARSLGARASRCVRSQVATQRRGRAHAKFLNTRRAGGSEGHE